MFITLQDYEDAARKMLLRDTWDYYAGGSEEEDSLRANRQVFAQWSLRPRTLVDVSHIETQTTILGMPCSMPVAIAPTAYAGLAHADAEGAVVQAAGGAGVLAIISINASRSLEDIAGCVIMPTWQQMYLYPDRPFTQELVNRIEANEAYCALVLTVDRPALGKRERDLRNGFRLSPGQAANFAASGVVPRENGCPATWNDVDWLRSITSLPLVLKGILTAEDARLALEHGVSAIIVSNHGGRQLDSAVTGMEALPEIVEAVAGRCEVYVDGGIRRGTDVFKALALGARSVLVGRPVLWGLAVNGTQGVRHVLEILRAELELTMKLAGCPTLASITPSLLFQGRGLAPSLL